MAEFKEKSPLQDKSELLWKPELRRGILKTQERIDEQLYRDYTSARSVAEIAAAEINEQLVQSRLIGEIVIISGGTIVTPHPRINLHTGSIDISTDIIQKEHRDPIKPSVAGVFTGIAASAQAFDIDFTLFFRATIGYQVALGEYQNHPNFAGSLFAFGAVTPTSIEFLEDRKTNEATEALKKIIANAADKQAVDFVRTLDQLLTSDDHYNPSNLEQLSYLIHAFLNNNPKSINESSRDLLLDLVRSRLGLYDDQIFEIHADHSVETRDPPGDYKVTGSVEERVPITGVTFGPHPQQQENTWQIDSSQGTLSLIIERTAYGEKQLVSVPVEMLQILRPVLTRQSPVL